MQIQHLQTLRHHHHRHRRRHRLPRRLILLKIERRGRKRKNPDVSVPTTIKRTSVQNNLVRSTDKQTPTDTSIATNVVPNKHKINHLLTDDAPLHPPPQVQNSISSATLPSNSLKVQHSKSTINSKCDAITYNHPTTTSSPNSGPFNQNSSSITIPVSGKPIICQVASSDGQRCSRGSKIYCRSYNYKCI